MKLFLLSQDANTGCNTYDSVVVAAEDYYTARHIHPHSKYFVDNLENNLWHSVYATWANSPYQVFVKYLGKASPGTKAGIICASFNEY